VPDTVAAFIGEPMLGTGGIVPPPAGYWQKIQAVLSRNTTSCWSPTRSSPASGASAPCSARTITASKPDLITIAKGLTSAYAPLSGVIVSDKVWQVLVRARTKLGSLGHGWTYSSHPICAAAGVANLELIDELDLVRNAGETGAYFRGELKEAVGDHKPMSARCAATACWRRSSSSRDRDDRVFFDPSLKIGPQVHGRFAGSGVIGRAMPQGDILGFAPPLCLTREEADQVVDATRRAVEAVANTL
jgi:L-2,4-diaminobutyrate transaminase